MAEDVIDIEFENLLRDAQHSEFMDVTRQLLSAIKDNSLQNESTSHSIKQVTHSFLKKLEDISEVKEPNVTVNTNQDAVIDELKKILEVATQKKEWIFTINKDLNNRLVSVTAKQS